MNAVDLREALEHYTVRNSGHEDQRNYLGMSQISKSEEELLRICTGDQWLPGLRDHLRLALGHVFEADMKDRLEGVFSDLGIEVYSLEGETLEADFDSRFKGHTDGWLKWQGEEVLIEIKSTFDEKLQRIISERRIPRSDYDQVQMYLHHGGFQRAFVIYIARETGRMWVHEVTQSPGMIERLNTKARRVLAAYDDWLEKQKAQAA